MRSVPVVCALAASACLSTPPPLEVDAAIDGPVDAEIDAPVCADGDGDGWPVHCPTRKHVDCDDTDADIHPGAAETAGTDNDCDGRRLTPAEAFPDLDAEPFGTMGQTITTRFGSYTLADAAGHQLSNMSVRLAGGNLSAELLYRGAALREMFSGVHVWDDFFSVDPAPDSDVVTPADPANSGPVVYQATVAYWSGGTAQKPALAGTARYTFTIDGRIIRTDDFVLAQQPVHEGPPDFPGITSHISLARGPAGNELFDRLVVRDSQLGVIATDLNDGSGGHNSLGDPFRWRWSCVYGPTAEVGFAPSIPTLEEEFGPGGQPRRSMRATSNIQPSFRQVALQYDWQQGVFRQEPQPPPPEPPVGPATLLLGHQRGHFMIYPRARSNTDCAPFDQQAQAYLNPPPLDLDGTGAIVDTDDGDEAHDGYVEGGGYWHVRALAPTGIRIAFGDLDGTTLPPHPLFRIRDLALDVEPLVFLNGTRLIQGLHYRLQRDGDVGIWLSLMGGMPLGHVVELVYPEPCNASCAN